MSTASEDVCAMCCQFRNRHKYLATHSRACCPSAGINSTEDGNYFIESEADDSNTGGAGGKNKSKKQPKPSEEPEAGAARETASKALSEPVTEGDEELKLYSPHELQRKADESRERMLLHAAEHVSMARVQREVYVASVAKAVEHAKANKPHGERSYCFVVD